MSISCPLCRQSRTTVHADVASFLKCHYCKSVFRDPAHHLSLQAEKERYLKHDNDVNDLGYQQFVAPMLSHILATCSPEQNGLDYGAGTGSVLANLLTNHGYILKLWDPFFHPDPSALKKTYDYIICCEVMEHFRDPHTEFRKLKNLLKPGGYLFCMTHLFSEEIPFASWYYQRDPTHVFLYSKESLDLIRQAYHFSTLEIDDRVVIWRN